MKKMPLQKGISLNVTEKSISIHGATTLRGKLHEEVARTFLKDKR